MRTNNHIYKCICFLFLMNIYMTCEAITAATNLPIRGHQPKLNQVLEEEIANEQFSLFAFSYNNKLYSTKNIDTLFINPSSDTIGSIVSPALLELSPLDANDVNGDDHLILRTRLAELAVVIKSAQGVVIPTGHYSKTFCELQGTYALPYLLEISGDIELLSQYGLPSQQDYSANAGVNVQPKNSYSIDVSHSPCYAQPNLKDQFRAPDETVFKNTLGFLLQSRAEPELNFPTTGFNGASFDLQLIDLDATTADWDVQYPKGITNSSAKVSVVSNNKINVELVGPSYNNPVPFIPTEIKIVDKNSRFEYPFFISSWFIISPNTTGGFQEAKTFCDSLANIGYRLPVRKELTNSVDAFVPAYDFESGLGGGDAGSAAASDRYLRAIGQGVFSEWGNSSAYYTKSDWGMASYWTSEYSNPKNIYYVSSNWGHVHFTAVLSGFRGACISTS